MRTRQIAVAEWLEPRRLLDAALFKDINLTQGTSNGLSEMIWAGNVAYLSQDDIVHGRELWKSDGSAAGTSLVKDIIPGTGTSAPSKLTAGANAGEVFFVASDPINGAELWRSDGSAAGTTLVKDINPNSASSNPSNLTLVNGILYFTATDDLHGTELWRSDGTAAGTRIVIDLDTSGGGTGSSNPRNFFGFNNALYFTATTAGTLYRTDGTAAGTSAFTGANMPRDTSSFAVLNNTMYFGAKDSTTLIAHIWRSDGTPANTIAIRGLNSVPRMLTKSGNYVFFVITRFTQNHEVWRTDGTVAGTTLVTLDNGGEQVTALADVNGTLVYAGGTIGTQLFRSDGGFASQIGGATYLTSLKSVGGFAYFNGMNSEVPGSTSELWRTDGTNPATLVADINPGVLGSVPMNLTETNVPGQFLFTANDGTTGGALMKSAGTAATTTLVKDIYPATGDAGPRTEAVFNGKLYFNASDGITSLPTQADGGEMWMTDGTAAGTSLLLDIFPGSTGSGARGAVVLGDKILFRANDGTHGKELWVSDGTPAGTSIVSDIFPGTGDGVTTSFFRSGNYIYFLASAGDGVSDTGVWRSDGTTAGTVRLTPAVSPSVVGTKFVEANGYVFFADVQGGFLWKTDGTPLGTSVVSPTTFSFGADNMASVNGKVVFSANTGAGYELYVSDGTDAGTGLLMEVNPGAASAEVTRFMPIDGAVLFFAQDPSHGNELWRTDGTPGGTTLVKDIAPGAAFGVAGGPTAVVSGVAYFIADDGNHGPELWRSDGTAAGTQLVKNIRAGGAGAGIQAMTAINGFLYFDANDGTFGDEGWVSDGTEEGTVSLGDLYAGPIGGTPVNFTALGDHVYFGLSNNVVGRELWRIDQPEFASLEGGALTVNGTANDDHLRLSQPGDGTLRIDFNGFTNSYPVASVSNIVFRGNDGNDTASFDSTLNASFSFTGGAGARHTVNVNAGTTTFATDLGASANSVSVNVAAGATAAFTNNQHLASLAIDGTATLGPVDFARRIVTKNLAEGSIGKLDLNDGSLILDYADASPLATVQSLINSARAAGTWTGNGLTSSAAKNAIPKNRTLGVMEASDYKSIYGPGAPFSGENVDATSVLVMFSYYGDADFNGAVNFDDYSRTDTGFNFGRTGWLNGDFDGNGVVNFDDYSLIDLAFNSQSLRDAGAVRSRALPTTARTS